MVVPPYGLVMVFVGKASPHESPIDEGNSFCGRRYRRRGAIQDRPALSLDLLYMSLPLILLIFVASSLAFSKANIGGYAH